MYYYLSIHDYSNRKDDDCTYDAPERYATREEANQAAKRFMITDLLRFVEPGMTGLELMDVWMDKGKCAYVKPEAQKGEAYFAADVFADEVAPILCEAEDRSAGIRKALEYAAQPRKYHRLSARPWWRKYNIKWGFSQAGQTFVMTGLKRGEK